MYALILNKKRRFVVHDVFRSILSYAQVCRWKMQERQGARGFADGSVHRRTRARRNVSCDNVFRSILSYA